MINKFICSLTLCFFAISFFVLDASHPSSTSQVTQLGDEQFEDFIKHADKPVIVDFWAEWCPPCKKMKPIFEQLAEELAGQYILVSINADKCPKTLKNYGIQSLPTFMIISSTKLLGKFTGYQTKEAFLKNVDNIVQDTVSQESLFSAIQINDQSLVAKCLKSKDIDVNKPYEVSIAEEVSIPMTPLMSAISAVMFNQSSPDVIFMLLNAGAELDLEIDMPGMNADLTITECSKVSARSFLEEMAKERTEKELAAIPEIHHGVVKDMSKRASLLQNQISNWKREK